MNEKNVTTVSWSEFIKLENEVKEILNDIIKININDKAIVDLLLINYKIFIELSNLIFNQIVINQSDNNVVYSSNSKYYQFLKEKGIPGHSIIEPLNINKLTLKQQIKNGLKWLKLFLKLNKITDIFYFSKVNFMLFESDSKYTLEYLKKKNSLIIPISLVQIINRKKGKIHLAKKELELSNYLSQTIKNKFNKLLSKYKVNQTKQMSDYIVNFLKAIFENSIFYLNIFDEYLKNKKPIKLFIGSNNNMLLRSFSVIVRKYGGKVSAFTHGEPLIYDWDKITWMELALVDEYFEYSQGLADSLKKMIKINSPVNNNKVKVRSFNTKFFRNTFQNQIKINSSDSIMFVANEYVREGQLSQVSSFPNSIQFDFETRLMKYLSKKFQKVYYKKHPGGVLKKEQIKFFPHNVEIIDEPFESVLNITNTIIFGHSRTTAIGSALATDKKIILFNGQWEKMEESILHILKKQVFILNYTEVDNRLIINYKELNQMLNSDKHKDLSFYENYLKN